MKHCIIFVVAVAVAVVVGTVAFKVLALRTAADGAEKAAYIR